jgi:hypothetical protein
MQALSLTYMRRQSRSVRETVTTVFSRVYLDPRRCYERQTPLVPYSSASSEQGLCGERLQITDPS